MEWKSPQADLKQHVVICNCSDKVRRIVAELHSEMLDERPNIVLVVQDNDLWCGNPSWHPDSSSQFTREHFFVVCARNEETLTERLRRVNIANARAAIILADPLHGALADARSTLVAVSIERENPQVHTVMELLASINRAHLQATEVNEVVCQGEIAEKLISQSCITPGVKNVFQSLLTNTPGTNNIYITPTPSSAVGDTYRELARKLITRRAPVILCGYLRELELPDDRTSRISRFAPGFGRTDIGAPEATSRLAFVINPKAEEEPGRDSVLTRDDQLVVIACRAPHLDSILD